MWNYIKDHFKPFWTGAVGSGVLWAPVLFADINSTVGIYLLRLLGAAGIAFISGLCTIAASDFYKEIKSRYKKRKDAKRKKQNDKDIEVGKRKEIA